SIDNWTPSKERAVQIRDSAAFWAKKALKIDRFSADAYLLMSKINDRRQFDSTLTYLAKALAISPNSFDVNHELGYYYSWKDPEKAIALCKKAIRLNTLSVWTPLVYRDLGFAYHSFGEFDKAEFYCKKAVELSNNSMITIEAARGVLINYLHWGK